MVKSFLKFSTQKNTHGGTFEDDRTVCRHEKLAPNLNLIFFIASEKSKCVCMPYPAKLRSDILKRTLV